jgi:hypothetical protein
MERLMQEIAGMGHALGLHFDPLPYAGKDAQSLETVLGLERRMLEHCAQCPVEVFSFHNPTLIRNLPQDMENWGGMVNAGARSIAKLYRYVSDSRGGWRRTDVPALLQTGGEPRLHILIHPFRWTPQIMTPRETLLRCVEGRAAAGRALAEKTIAAWGTGEVDESRDHLLSAWVGTASPS